MRLKELLAVPVLALAAGCGGDSDQGPSTTSTAPSTPTTQSGGPPAPQAPEPAKQAGGEPTVVSGGTSIESFGAEAKGTERAAILASFEGYLNALAQEDPATACSHLAAATKRSLEQFVPKRLKDRGCAAILPNLLTPTAPVIAQEQVNGQIAKVRVEGGLAFVVFQAPGAKLFQQTMTREGGQWKVTTVITSVLVPEL